MGGDEVREGARRRWGLLAAAVRGRWCQADGGGPRLGLVSISRSPHLPPGWAFYSLGGSKLKVRHVPRNVAPERLTGFNNTGNIRVWPSEEVLAHVVMTGGVELADKTVLELGGGMSCLAGMFIAKYSNAKFIHLTDGNPASVDNVRAMVLANGLNDRVFVETLCWVNVTSIKTYDLVLAADCLFFDDAREELVSAVWATLKNDGIALVAAPKRGTTLNTFVSLAQAKGFFVTVSEHYSEFIWEARMALSKDLNSHYDPDSHYPILITLTKSPTVKNKIYTK